MTITHHLRSILVLAAILAVAAFAAGCGGGDDAGSEGSNATDATFAAQMLPHHEHAVEMADLAVEKSSNEGVRSLAEGIIDTQKTEISTLEGFLDTFGEQPAEPASQVMALNEGIIAELEQASGADFDRLFLKAMSAHHSSAVDMAGMEINGGEYEETVALAKSIEETQLEEIAEMDRLMSSA